MKSLLFVLMLVLAPFAVAYGQDVQDMTESQKETAKAFQWGMEHKDCPIRQEPTADRRDFVVNDDVARQRAASAAANARRAVATVTTTRREVAALKQANLQRDKKVYWNKQTKKFEFINLPSLRDRVDDIDTKATAAGTAATNAKATAEKADNRAGEVEKKLKDKTGHLYDLASIHDNANEAAFWAPVAKARANLALILWAVLLLFVLVLFVVVIRHVRTYRTDREVILTDFRNRGII